MTGNEVRAKFVASASLAFPNARATAIADAVLDLPRASARSLMALLRG
jgi:hypothetical protein